MIGLSSSSLMNNKKVYGLFIWSSILLISLFFVLGTRPAATTSSSSSTTPAIITPPTTTVGGPLPFNDINILVVTDVHSWVASQKRHESQYNVDYGHVVSFYEQLIPRSSEQNLFFVMNGDFMDGTGLSEYPPEHLVELLKKMPFDALNVGNHELYFNSTVDFMLQKGGFVDHFGEKYVTSNVLLNRPPRNPPLGGSKRYTVMEGPSAQVLVFGFLYDMPDHCSNVIVKTVENVIEEKWFLEALQNTDYDAILCLSHMDVEDELLSLILHKIRDILGDADMPIHFITGHTHYRGFKELDNSTDFSSNKKRKSTSFEAGHYLDTIGFLSFDRDSDVKDDEYNQVDHVFIDANVDTLSQILGMDDFMTPYGKEVQDLILQTEQEMNLFDVLGCAPTHYYLDYELSRPQSLWRFFMEQVINAYYFGDSKAQNSVYVQSSGSFRYDIYEGEVTLNDIKTVNPWNNTIVSVTTMIEGMELIHILGDDDGTINSLKNSVFWKINLPTFVSSKDSFDQRKVYELYTNDFDLPAILTRMKHVLGDERTDAIVHLEYQTMATTDLLFNFVAEKWQHHKSCKHNVKKESTTVFLSLAIVYSIVFISFIGIKEVRRRQLRGHDLPDRRGSYNQASGGNSLDPEFVSNARAASDLFIDSDEDDEDEVDLEFLYRTSKETTSSLEVVDEMTATFKDTSEESEDSGNGIVLF